MSLTTPTTSEIRDTLLAQVEASLGQTVPRLPRSAVYVIAVAMAGVFTLLYKYAGFTFLQMFVTSASNSATVVNGRSLVPLVEWGRLIGIGDPAPATQAELTVEVTVLTQGGTLPSGTQLLSSATGVTYITLGAVLLNAATVSATVRAVSDQAGGGGAGAIGNLDPGASLSFANPLAAVARDATVAAQVVTGADAEATEAYRQRILDRFQKRPQGGAYADYEQWGEEPAGIVNVYPYTSACPGQVDLYVEATPESSGDPDGIPTAAQLQEVLDSVELDASGLASRRPANALVNAFPITRVGFTINVAGLFVDDLADTQADIEAALTDYLLNREPYLPGLSTLPRKDRVTRSALSGVVDDVVSARGGIFGSVTVSTAGTPLELYSLGIGEKAKASSITFI